MTVLQCGFIANGATTAGRDNVSISNPTPVISGERKLDAIFEGGWGFGLGCTTDDRQCCCWGVNAPTILRKQGDADTGADPNELEIIASDSVETACAGFDHVVLVHTNGKLSLLSPHIEPKEGPALPIPMDVPIKAVAAGEHHSIFLTHGGDVYGVGKNKDGQLGSVQATSTTIKEASKPILILGPTVNGGPKITAIAAGARHNLVATEGGKCLTWGSNLRGQCGTGEVSVSLPTPSVVGSLGPLNVIGVAAGMEHSVCLTDSGDVYTWGSNSDGQLGLVSSLSDDQTESIEKLSSAMNPTLVEAPGFDDETVSKITAGSKHSVALCRSGSAYAWGCGQFGALGTGSRQNEIIPTKVLINEKILDVASGWWHTLFLV